ncbi:hypothetical protein [Pseudomonas citronellolis]|uniref:hypothetical protein n=1 Tax=Pseudomonas citronellolis TaxID=53408 RepID=UPI0023E3C3C7|nr:hypothetical protein [Pseudomonas citronellolis]MDF3935866.1 hypothetical protein [Pseudomonas citronellolis]
MAAETLDKARESKRLGQSTEAVDNRVDKMMKTSYTPCPMGSPVRLVIFSPIEKSLYNQ